MMTPDTSPRRAIAAVAAMLVTSMCTAPVLAANEQGSQNGMPFRTLQEQIDLLAIDLSEAVNYLQGQIDQLVIDQADQNTLIAALQSALATLDVRVSGNEVEIAALQAMQDLQGQLIQALEDSVADLEAQVAANTSDVTALILADQALHELIAAIQSEISTINLRIDNNDGDIATLQAQIALLQTQLASVQGQLAAKQDRVDGVCAAGSSIREIHPDGSVVCEADSVSSSSGMLDSYRSWDVVSIDSSIVFTQSASNSRYCSGSYDVVGGGYSVNSHLGVGNTYRSYPNGSNGWTVNVRSDSTGSRSLTTYVVCARVQ